MRLALAGDEASYRSLLLQLAVWLRSAVRWRVHRYGLSPTDVEDVVQETLLAVHLKRQTWRSLEPISPWVLAIARHKWLDHCRRRGRRAEWSLDAETDFPDKEVPLEPYLTMEAAGDQHDVEKLLGRLDDRARQIVQRMGLEGCAARDVAEELNMSEGGVRVALHRALKVLAQVAVPGRPEQGY